MRRRKKFAIYALAGLLGGFAALVWLDMGTDPLDMYDRPKDDGASTSEVGDPVPPRYNGAFSARVA